MSTLDLEDQLIDQQFTLMQKVYSFSISNTLHTEMDLLGAEAWELQFSRQSKIAQGDITGSASGCGGVVCMYVCEDLKHPCICWWTLRVSKCL